MKLRPLCVPVQSTESQVTDNQVTTTESQATESQETMGKELFWAFISPSFCHILAFRLWLRWRHRIYLVFFTRGLTSVPNKYFNDPLHHSTDRKSGVMTESQVTEKGRHHRWSCANKNKYYLPCFGSPSWDRNFFIMSFRRHLLWNRHLQAIVRWIWSCAVFYF